MPPKKPTCSDLRQLLTSAGIPVHSKANKSELQRLVEQHLSAGGVSAIADDEDSDGGDEDDQHDLLDAFDDEHDIAEALKLLKQGYIEKVTRKGYENMQKKLYVWLHEKQTKGKHQTIKLEISQAGVPTGIEGVIVARRCDTECAKQATTTKGLRRHTPW
jgi:hypothetical protein